MFVTLKNFGDSLHSSLGHLIESCGRDRVYVEELSWLLATLKALNLPNLSTQLAMEQTSRSTCFLDSLYLIFNCNHLLSPDCLAPIKPGAKAVLKLVSPDYRNS